MMLGRGCRLGREFEVERDRGEMRLGWWWWERVMRSVYMTTGTL